MNQLLFMYSKLSKALSNSAEKTFCNLSETTLELEGKASKDVLESVLAPWLRALPKHRIGDELRPAYAKHLRMPIAESHSEGGLLLRDLLHSCPPRSTSRA